jgi:ribose transport system ATP-binding protein
MTDALRVTDVAKTFGMVRALDRVSLDVARGEIHAIVGGNGSGKSTLIKVLAGVVTADRGGTLAVGSTERPADAWSPALANASGLRFVHQDLPIFPGLTVAENLALGREYPTRFGKIMWRANARQAAKLLGEFDVAISPEQDAGTLRPAERTMLGIASALQGILTEGLLVLDEPTAALTTTDAERVLAMAKRYAETGGSVIFVSHRFPEVIALSDRVTVLQDGHVVATVNSADTDETELVELMVAGGARRRESAGAAQRRSGDVALTVSGLAGGRLKGLDFEVHAGEILGIAGLLGAGRSAILRTLFGCQPYTTGEIRLAGQPYRPTGPSGAIARGVALVPENRATEGMFLPQSVRENLSATVLSDYWTGLRISRRRERDASQALIDSYDIRAANMQAPVQSLSGGNQQKVLIARWLRMEPTLLLLDEPTQGVDVNARREIHSQIAAAAENGSAVIVVSSEFEELLEISDRLLIVVDGRIEAERMPATLSIPELASLTYGSHQESERAHQNR